MINLKGNLIIILIILIIILVIITLLTKKNKNKSNFENNDLLSDLFKKFQYKFESVNKFDDIGVVDCIYCVVMPKRKKYMEGIFNKMKL